MIKTNNYLHSEITDLIIKAYYNVYNKLGFGFLEKVYENALMLLLRRGGIEAKQQAPIKVYFEGEVVGEYFADILVDDKIILELKVLNEITDVHIAQSLN